MHIHKCTNTVYDYAIFNYYYFSLMYKLKKIVKTFTSTFVGTEPSSYIKKKEFTGPQSHKG